MGHSMGIMNGPVNCLMGTPRGVSRSNYSTSNGTAHGSPRDDHWSHHGKCDVIRFHGAPRGVAHGMKTFMVFARYGIVVMYVVFPMVCAMEKTMT